MTDTSTTVQAPYNADGVSEVQSNWEGNIGDSSQNPRPASTGFSVLGAFDFLSSNKKVPFVAAIAGLMIGLLWLLMLMLSSSSHVYRYVIQFTFSGVEDSTYPDGTAFSVSDVIAPKMLDLVYDENDIQQYGLSSIDFAKAFQIVPVTDSRNAIIAKYNAIFDEKKSTLAEIEENQSAMSNELRTLSRRAAVIIFNDTTLKIPAPLATKIVSDVVSGWAKYAIDVEGVIANNLNAPVPSEFDASEIGALDRISALRLLVLRAGQLAAYIDTLSDQPNGRDIVDSETGKNTLSLRNDLQSELLQIKKYVSGWATLYADESTYFASPIQLFSQNIFIPENAEAADYLIALELVEDARRALVDNVVEIERTYGNIAVRDPETGIGVKDISRFAERIRQYDLTQLRALILTNAAAKDSTSLRSYYETRLRDLESRTKGLAEQIQVVDQAIQQQLSRGPMTGFSGSLTGEASSPEMDAAFLDRLLALSGQTERDDFVRGLVREKIDLNSQTIDLNTQIDRIKSDLRMIGINTGDQPIISPAVGENDAVPGRLRQIAEQLQTYAAAIESISARFVLATEIFSIVDGGENPQFNLAYYLRKGDDTGFQLSDAAAAMKEIATTASRLEDIVVQTAFDGSRRLYRPVSEVEQTTYSPVNVWNTALVILLGFLGSIIGLGVVLVRYVLRVLKQQRAVA